MSDYLIEPGVAAHRSGAYVWAKWLARLMTEDPVCGQQVWLQANYRLPERPDVSASLLSWQVAHGRLVEETRLALVREGRNARPGWTIHFELAAAKIGGRPDLVAISSDEVQIYDAKTGRPSVVDSAQVAIYRFLFEHHPAYRNRRIRGFVVYPSERIEVPIVDQFAEHLEFWVTRLVDGEALPANPGYGCRYCEFATGICLVAARQED